MANQTNYELALELRDLALWDFLSDSELFGIRCGERTFYCCVMGMAGEFHALAVYTGASALSTHFSIRESDGFSLNLALAQDLIMCSFEYAQEFEPEQLALIDYDFDEDKLIPFMERHRPYLVPTPLDDEDNEILTAALRGAIYIAKLIRDDDCDPEDIGLRPLSRYSSVIPVVYNANTQPVIEIETMPITHPEAVIPELNDDLLCARARQAQQSSTILLCEVLRLTLPTKGDDCSYFPLALFMLDRDNEMALPPIVGADAETVAVGFAKMCVTSCPRELRVRNQETQNFFAKLSEQLDIPVVSIEPHSEDYDILDDFVAQLFNSLQEMDGTPPLSEDDDPFAGAPIGRLSEEDHASLLELMQKTHITDDDSSAGFSMSGLNDDEIIQLYSFLDKMYGSDDEFDDDCDDDCGCGHHHHHPHIDDEDTLYFHDTGYQDDAWSADISADGRCEYCGGVFKPNGMLRHLHSCKKRQREAGEQEYFLIRVDSENVDGYFLYLDVASDTKLDKLDDYLREIWVECCGHDSVFVISGDEYYSECIDDDDLTMNYPLKKVVEKGSVFHYEYDFGTPTLLRLTVCDTYTAKRRRAKITLAARNLPPVRKCSRCGENASFVCPECGAELCSSCGSKHSCMPLYEMLPLVNSPRCGVCAYGQVFDSDDYEF